MIAPTPGTLRPIPTRRTAWRHTLALLTLLAGGAAHAADPPEPPIFVDGFDGWVAVCSSLEPIQWGFRGNESASDFFIPAWQQRKFGDRCPSGSEMLGFRDAECHEVLGSPANPSSPPEHTHCTANLCCGAPPPIPTCDQPADAGIPPEALDVEPPVDEEETRGSLSDLYPGQDTRTGDFRDTLACDPAIGETDIPPEVDEPPEAEVLQAEEALETWEQSDGSDLAAQQTSAPAPISTSPGHIPDDVCYWSVLPPLLVVPCEQMLDPTQPFDGRDVIYVRGFGTEQIKDALLFGDSEARKTWPEDRAAFEPGGYFYGAAYDYWKDHIREHLWAVDGSPWDVAGWQWWAGDADPNYRPKKNRVLIVAWSTNQRLNYSQHAFLTQVSDAIKYGRNVLSPPGLPTHQYRPFCANGCVIISHSTGGLLVSSALGAVNAGAYGLETRSLLSHLRVHVAFDSAISGSRLASTALAVGSPMMTDPMRDSLCAIVRPMFDTDLVCGMGVHNVLQQSVLVDLMPMVAQSVWGPVLSLSPVPTLTVAGGAPVGNYVWGGTKWLLPGIDDGVVTANSACGNPNPVWPDGVSAPSGVIVRSLRKSFDLGDKLSRATQIMIAQKNLMAGHRPAPLNYLAGMCTPYLSPSGMVLPVVNSMRSTPWDPRRRYPNHYSMIQSIEDHSYNGGGDAANPWPSSVGAPASAPRHYLEPRSGWVNNEESSAVTDAGIFRQFPDGSYLVKPQFANSVEIVKGKSIKFRLFRRTHKVWLWKRTYERLAGWETKQSSHYVYEFVARH